MSTTATLPLPHPTTSGRRSLIWWLISKVAVLATEVAGGLALWAALRHEWPLDAILVALGATAIPFAFFYWSTLAAWGEVPGFYWRGMTAVRADIIWRVVFIAVLTTIGGILALDGTISDDRTTDAMAKIAGALLGAGALAGVFTAWNSGFWGWLRGATTSTGLLFLAGVTWLILMPTPDHSTAEAVLRGVMWGFAGLPVALLVRNMATELLRRRHPIEPALPPLDGQQSVSEATTWEPESPLNWWYRCLPLFIVFAAVMLPQEGLRSWLIWLTSCVVIFGSVAWWLHRRSQRTRQRA